MSEEKKQITITVDVVTEKLKDALTLDLEFKGEAQKIAFEWTVRYLGDLGVRLSISEQEYERLKLRPFTSVIDKENESTNT